MIGKALCVSRFRRVVSSGMEAAACCCWTAVVLLCVAGQRQPGCQLLCYGLCICYELLCMYVLYSCIQVQDPPHLLHKFWERAFLMLRERAIFKILPSCQIISSDTLSLRHYWVEIILFVPPPQKDRTPESKSTVPPCSNPHFGLLICMYIWPRFQSLTSVDSTSLNCHVWSK